MFPDYRKVYDGGPSWSLWPEMGDCSGVVLTFFVYARGLAAEARLHAFVEALVIQTAAALGSERYLAADDAHYVTVNDYRGAAVDSPFQR